MIIRESADEFDVLKMCEVLDVSRSGYYRWSKRPESTRKRENRRLTKLIREIHMEHRKVYGSPRIHAILRRKGERCSLNRVARLMKEARIKARQKKKFKATTNSRHGLPVWPNLLDRRFHIAGPNQAWVSDISYVRTTQGWLYLAATLDLHNRQVVGWSMDKRMTSELVCDALKMAIKRRRPPVGLIHHSDRGRQYCSTDFQKLLGVNGMHCSMSRKGNCWDNAPMESFFHTMKTELVYLTRYETRAQARQDIFEYIEVFYNRKRIHSTLGYCTPVEFETQAFIA